MYPMLKITAYYNTTVQYSITCTVIDSLESATAYANTRYSRAHTIVIEEHTTWEN